MSAKRRGLVDEAASDLRATSRAFSSGNLYHAARRLRPALAARWSLEAFCAGPLAKRQRRGPIPGLLATSGASTAPSPIAGLAERELDAYFPAAILLVDRPAIVDLFAASGALVQARVAVVCVDGSPRPVVSWLRRCAGKGHRAPVGYLHDARTVLYPFLFEPLATLTREARGKGLLYRDLGIGPGRALRDPLGVAPGAGAARWLEEVPPCSLVAYAMQEVLRMVAPDPLLLPMRAPHVRAG